MQFNPLVWWVAAFQVTQKKMHDSAKTIPASVILHDLKENLYF